MKSLVDFISENAVEDLKGLTETMKPNPNDPPAVMIMKRKSIRQFPNGQRVALYYIEKLKKYISIPYDNLGVSIGVMEHIEELDENVIHHLKDIVSTGGAKRINFKDGSSIKVDQTTANAVLTAHNALNDENKQKVSDLAHKSKHHFMKVVDFAWKHVK